MRRLHLAQTSKGRKLPLSQKRRLHKRYSPISCAKQCVAVGFAFRSLGAAQTFYLMSDSMQTKTADSFILKVVCFLIPASIVFQVNAGSQIFLPELLLPSAAAVIFINSHSKIIGRELTFLLTLGSAYLFFQFLSDIWNHTSFDQYSRGWARIILFLLNLISIYIIIDNKRSRLLTFCLGFAFGRICITALAFDGDTIPWKIGLAKPMAMLAILLCVTMPMPSRLRACLSSAVLASLGIFDILMDFRSHGSVLLLISMILLTSTFMKHRPSRHQSRALRPALYVLIAVGIAGFSAYQFYSFAAQSGWLSENATRKYQVQVEGTDAPLIVAGRSEVLVYFEAMFDSVLIGHGSWPRDAYYAEKLAERRYSQGLSPHLRQPTDDSIPIHSHIFGSWIEAGIVGGLFWINILFLIYKSILRSSQGQSQMRPLYLYGAMLLAWDILFSPFSGFRRLETALLIVILLRSLLQRHPVMSFRALIRSRSSRSNRQVGALRHRQRSSGRPRKRRIRHYQPS